MKHILIDYENIQPKKIDDVEIDSCHVWLFPGVNQQKNLPLELVETLLKFDSKNVHIIRMQHTGKNALDFYLSFYLGKISEIDSQADVCILARDSGYDVLVEHLNSVYDGIDIIRSANTNQLSLSYDSDDKTELDIEKSQFIVESKQNTLYDNISNVMTKNENTVAESPEDNIPKAVIHDGYILVFDAIVNSEVFLPSYKANLLSAMKKYALMTILEQFNSAEQDYIVEKVFEKFVKAGIINLDTKTKKLSYKVDSQGILDLVTDKVLLSKAKTVEGLNKVIKQKPINSRPSKKSTLINYLKSHLRNEDPKVVDNIIKQMSTNKIIVISNTNKLSYNI